METIPQHELEPEPLGRDLYLTPESLAIASLVDAMDRRIYKRWKKKPWELKEEV